MLRNRLAKAKSGRAHSTGRANAAPVLPHGSENFPVVGIGASAGGLDACSALLGALPPNNGMVFILVQHLDPTHESMMAELLAHHTSMTVVQATSGILIEPNHCQSALNSIQVGVRTKSWTGFMSLIRDFFDMRLG